MKIELKNLKVSPHLSQETNAFTADIWLDGKRVGHARNQGHGGNTDICIEDPTTRQRLQDWCKAQPPVPSSYGGDPLPMDDELYIDRLVEKAEKLKIVKDQLRRKKGKTLVKLRDDPRNSFSVWNVPYTPEVGAKIRAAQGDKLLVIFNEDPVLAAELL
jgi:hypothetical protein